MIWVPLPNMAAKLTLDMQKPRYRYDMYIFHLIIVMKCSGFILDASPVLVEVW